MKAAYFTQYGAPDVVTLEELPKPQPRDNEILVRIVSSAVTIADSRIRGARFPKGFEPFARLAFGIKKPRIHVLGSCYSGVVETMGKSVSGYAPGDELCGMRGMKMGAHAEYVLIKASSAFVKKPSSISHDEAAAMLFGGTTALYFIRDLAKVSKGQSVLINGASGAVGTNAIQLATYFGAVVTAVASASNQLLVTSLGAKDFIDYTKTNVAAIDERYDLVIDTVGTLGSRGVHLLKPAGKLALVVTTLSETLQSLVKPNLLSGTSGEKKEDMAFLIDLMVQGKLKAVIDSVYELADISKAHKTVDGGHKIGNVIVHPSQV